MDESSSSDSSSDSDVDSDVLDDDDDDDDEDADDVSDLVDSDDDDDDDDDDDSDDDDDDDEENDRFVYKVYNFFVVLFFVCLFAKGARTTLGRSCFFSSSALVFSGALVDFVCSRKRKNYY